MNWEQIRSLRKKEKASPYLEICRSVGLGLTWFLVKCLPNISANAVTISMLVINIMSGAFLYSSITTSSLCWLLVSFVLFNLSICLDCVDGNIARLRNQQSFFGVFLDRLVHNVSYPLQFFVVAYAVYCQTHNIMLFNIVVFAGILTELSPIDVAIKDVENLFVRQLLTRQTKIYSHNEHAVVPLPESLNQSNVFRRTLRFIYDIFPSWNQLFVVVLLDLLVPSLDFRASVIYSFLFCVKQLFAQSRRVKKHLADINDRVSQLSKYL